MKKATFKDNYLGLYSQICCMSRKKYHPLKKEYTMWYTAKISMNGSWMHAGHITNLKCKVF
jgi:hypothetical protein